MAIFNISISSLSRLNDSSIVSVITPEASHLDAVPSIIKRAVANNLISFNLSDSMQIRIHESSTHDRSISLIEQVISPLSLLISVKSIEVSLISMNSSPSRKEIILTLETDQGEELISSRSSNDENSAISTRIVR